MNKLRGGARKNKKRRQDKEKQKYEKKFLKIFQFQNVK